MMSMPATEATMDVARLTPVWHVGRHGDVAGGMTQVVNGYLNWSFTRTRPAVLVSRDGTRGLRALGLFLRACFRLACLPHVAQSVVVVHLSQGGSFVREGALLCIARWRGAGAVAHLHGSSFVPFSRRHPRLVGTVLRQARRVIVLSDETSLAASQFVAAERIALLPNAVSPGKQRPKEKIVVFGGAVSRRKGVDVLAQAWREHCSDLGWRLVIAGPVRDSDVVDDALPAAEFVGPVAHHELMSLLERSAVAVLPSRDEAMPMFILEAMARGNCVVSTRVGGIPSVLADGCGWVVNPGDAAALGHALASVLSDTDTREQLAEAAHRRFEAHYAASAVYPRVERVWLESLDRHG